MQEIATSYQLLKNDVLSEILKKAHKTFKSARKNAVDLYSRNLKGKQFKTLEEFNYSHNQSYEAAMELVTEIQISGAEHIQEITGSKLKHVMLLSLNIIIIQIV